MYWESRRAPQGPGLKSWLSLCWKLQKFWRMESSGWQNTGEPDSSVWAVERERGWVLDYSQENNLLVHLRAISETLETLLDFLGRKFYSQHNMMVFKQICNVSSFRQLILTPPVWLWHWRHVGPSSRYDSHCVSESHRVPETSQAKEQQVSRAELSGALWIKSLTLPRKSSHSPIG